LALSWVSNPFTLLPLTYFTYKVGNFILGEPQSKLQALFREFIWNFKTDHYWDSFSMWILQFGKAFFVGLPIVAFGMAILGYSIVTLFWAAKSFLRYHRK